MEASIAMTKAQQLSTAMTLVGFQCTGAQAEIILGLMELLNAHGDKVSLGDIQKVVKGVAEKQAAKAAIMTPNNNRPIR